MNEISCKICGSQLTAFIKDIFDDRHGFIGRFDINRCANCGFGQTIPEIPEDKTGEIYTRFYPRKTTINLDTVKTQRVKLMSPVRRWLLGINNTAHYHIRKGTKVLDIGCGDCTSIREINAFGAEGYGIEPDKNIRELVAELKLNVHVGLFEEMPYPPNYFDFITMSQVLEHVHRPVDLLTSFQRVLKDKGQIIIGVPNADSRLRRKYGNRWLNWHVPYHINHFTSKSLYLLAERSGFQVRKIRTYTPNLWVDLQTKLVNYHIEEGVRVPFLNGETDMSFANNTELRPSRFQRMIDYIEQFSGFRALAQIVTLRLVDAMGFGESYLVVLEQKNLTL
jgi:SAM-dependent methyltransferase